MHIRHNKVRNYKQTLCANIVNTTTNSVIDRQEGTYRNYKQMRCVDMHCALAAEIGYT